MRHYLLLASALIIVSGLLFGHGINAPFVLDEVNKIKANPDLHSPQFRLNDFFYKYSAAKPPNRNDPSRPLPYMLYWLCWQSADGATWPFHLLNIILHTLCAFAVSLIVMHFYPQGFLLAGFAGLWFLSLPLNAGTVAYTYSLNDVLATLFALLIFLLSLKDKVYYIPILLLYVLALASKQSMVVIPGLIVASDFFRQKLALKRLPLYLLMALFTLGYILIRFLHLGGVGDLEGQLLIPQDVYLIAEGVALWMYFSKFIVPINLSIQHSVQPFHYLWAIAGWVAIVSLCLVSLLPRFRKEPIYRWLALAFILFLMVLIPTSSFFPTADLFVERRAYLGTGLAIAFLAVWLGQFSIPKAWAAGLATLLISINCFATFKQVRLQTSETALWNHVLSLYPRDTRALLGLSYNYLNNKKYPEAEEVLLRLIEINPQEPDGLINLGALYHLTTNPKHDKQKALYYYKKALEVRPQDGMTWMNIGLLFLGVKKLKDAEMAFSKSMAINSKNWVNYHGLAQVYDLQGKKEQAKQFRAKAEALKPRGWGK